MCLFYSLVYLCLSICRLVCPRPPYVKKNDGDLKFGAPPDHIHKLFFSKSVEGEQAVGGILIFTRIYVFPSVCLTPFDQTKRRQTWNWLHTLAKTIYKNANVKIDQFWKMQLLHIINFLYWIFIFTQDNY